MTYDRADWHYNGDYPQGLPEENGGTHIGMFLAWIFINNLEGELHRRDSAQALADVRARRITGRDFLFQRCSEKLWSVDLSDLGNAFAKEYYAGEGFYFNDYIDALCSGDPEEIYNIADSWENYDKLAPVISRRFEEWKSR